MVHSLTPEDNSKFLENKQKAKRFSYQTFHKENNPWAEGVEGDGEGITQVKFTTQKFSLGISDSKSSRNFDLNNVWSIRNNVSLNQWRNTGTTLQNHPVKAAGIYSRHKTSTTIDSNMKVESTNEKVRNEGMMFEAWNRRKTGSMMGNAEHRSPQHFKDGFHHDFDHDFGRNQVDE